VSIRPIRCLGDPVLRTACDPVTRFDDALAGLVADLIDTVQEPGRAGLAANQIGSTLAVFSYNVEGQLGYLINPQIVELGGTDEGPEGCLSIPGITAVRRRAARAVATGQNLDQDRVTITGSDELARCLQHETDHLRGELFIDRLESAERRRVIRSIYAEQIAGDVAASGRPSNSPLAPGRPVPALACLAERRGFDATPTGEPIRERVIPRELALPFEPAEQHCLPGEVGRKVQQQRRDALDLQAGRAEPADDLAELCLEPLGLGQAAERRGAARGERRLDLDEVGPDLNQFVGPRQEFGHQVPRLGQRERPVHSR
jgi:peptide deformylase